VDKGIRFRRSALPLKRPGMWLSPFKSSRVRIYRGCKVFEVWYTPHRGWYCSRVFIAGTSPAPECVVLPIPGDKMKKIALGSVASDSAAHHLAPVESTILSRLPHLVTHCCVTRYDDGDSRRPGWFTIKTQGSSWVVQVKDPNACAQLQCLGNTLDDALMLADMLLGSESAPWEVDPFQKAQEAKKKK